MHRFNLLILRAFFLAPALGCGRVAAPLHHKHDMTAASSAASAISADCDAFLSSLPPVIDRGWLAVPENWAVSGASPSLSIFYYIMPPALGQVAAGGPVLFLNGGPGADSHSSYERLKDNPFARRHTMIFMDQRGTGCSTPMPNGRAEADLRRLALYGSEGIVRDAEALRERLYGAHSTWRVFGQSNGSIIAHRYAALAPESLQVAIAHGSAINERASKERLLAEAIKAQRDQSEAYFARYPEDRARSVSLRAKLPDARCFTAPAGDRLCGAGVVDFFFLWLDFRGNESAVHVYLNLLLQDDAVNEAVLNDFVARQEFTVFGPGLLANEVINEVDAAEPVSSDAKPKLGPIFAKAGVPVDHPGFFSLRFYAGLHPAGEDLLNGLNLSFAPLTMAAFRAGLSRNPQLCFHLYAGAKDAIAPPIEYEAEAAALGDRITYTLFPDSGHEGFLTEAKVWSDLDGRRCAAPPVGLTLLRK